MKPTNPVWLVLCVLGVLLALSGFVWGSSSNQTIWTEEQATKRAEASARFHAAAHSHGDHAHDNHADSAAAAELAAAKKEYDEQQAKFAAAVKRKELLSAILKWGGLAMAAISGGGYLISNRAGEDD